MPSTVPDAPLVLVLAVAAVLGGLQAAAYGLARRGIDLLVADDEPVLPLAGLLLVFALAAAASATAPAVGGRTAAVGSAVLTALLLAGWWRLRRHPRLRLALAAPTVARRLGLRTAGRGAALIGVAGGFACAAGALGTGVGAPWAAWSALIAAIALAPPAAIPVAAAAGLLDATLVATAPQTTLAPAAGIALALTAALLGAVVPGLDGRGTRP